MAQAVTRVACWGCAKKWPLSARGALVHTVPDVLGLPPTEGWSAQRAGVPGPVTVAPCARVPDRGLCPICRDPACATREGASV